MRTKHVTPKLMFLLPMAKRKLNYKILGQCLVECLAQRRRFKKILWGEVIIPTTSVWHVFKFLSVNKGDDDAKDVNLAFLKNNVDSFPHNA